VTHVSTAQRLPGLHPTPDGVYLFGFVAMYAFMNWSTMSLNLDSQFACDLYPPRPMTTLKTVWSNIKENAEVMVGLNTCFTHK
jgi:hypothetical protein